MGKKDLISKRIRKEGKRFVEEHWDNRWFLEGDINDRLSKAIEHGLDKLVGLESKSSECVFKSFPDKTWKRYPGSLSIIGDKDRIMDLLFILDLSDAFKDLSGKYKRAGDVHGGYLESGIQKLDDGRYILQVFDMPETEYKVRGGKTVRV